MNKFLKKSLLIASFSLFALMGSQYAAADLPLPESVNSLLNPLLQAIGNVVESV